VEIDSKQQIYNQFPIIQIQCNDKSDEKRKGAPKKQNVLT